MSLIPSPLKSLSACEATTAGWPMAPCKDTSFVPATVPSLAHSATLPEESVAENISVVPTTDSEPGDRAWAPCKLLKSSVVVVPSLTQTPTAPRESIP